LQILLELQKQNRSIKTSSEFISSLQQILKQKYQLSKTKQRLTLPENSDQLRLTRQPSFWHFRFVLLRHEQQFKPSFVKQLLAILIKTAVRSQSGIAAVSVFTKGVACPFHCLYCANEPDIPKSYFSDEPAVKRALRYNFDPYEQTLNRLIMLYLSGHPIDKIELIIQGGTFSYLDKKYREWFVTRCFDAANQNIFEIIKSGLINPSIVSSQDKATGGNLSTLQLSQQTNQSSSQRIIGLTVETRPDYINIDELWFLRKLGVTRVELGVQTTDEKVLKAINRGHNLQTVVDATKLLKDFGFKITYHLMPGLPGSNLKKDLAMLKEVFIDARFKPDNLKFYPCSVVRNSELAKWYQEGMYQPYSEEDLTELILAFKKTVVPRWVRIQRLVRDLTVNDLVVDSFPSNTRQNIEKKMAKLNIHCPCIRCREIKRATNQKLQTGQLSLKITKYPASQGEELFLEIVDQQDRLYGLLRLRLTKNHNKNYLAIIRELHIYGETVRLEQKDQYKPQHQGLGKWLLQEAENIARQNNCSTIAVIAGVGARPYYTKLGYFLSNTYMTKDLLRSFN
jgi:elongator complex protein 3